MNDLTITRFARAPFGVFGSMDVDGATLYTVEKPWLNNQPSISCIPTGIYRCKPRWYYRGGYDAIEITDVPDRTHILFHKGNRPSDFAGCIGVTSYLGCLNGDWAGLNSAAAFERLMDELGDKEFDVEIKNDVGVEAILTCPYLGTSGI